MIFSAATVRAGLGVLVLGGMLASPLLAADEKRPSPEDHYNGIVAAGKQSSKNGAGEDFAWHVAYSLGDFVAAYQAWKDPAWLDAGVKSYDYTVSQMREGPDGYKGWVGPCDDKVSADVHVGDAILLNDMLAFSELVLKDPELKKKYGEAANRYVEIAKRDFVEKWVKRGTWHEDGPYGSFAQWDMYCPINDIKTWSKGDGNESGLSLPFNKQNDAGMVLMKLYRITGDKSFRDKAQKIFAFMKSRMMLVGDYYVWNYWEPFGPWDVDMGKKDTRHWMNVHGYRNYQAGEIAQIVEAYNTGIVFDQKDIELILNTNLEVMWNKDKAAPKFVNSNAQLPENPLTPAEQKARDEEVAKNPYAKEGRAGCLWTALVPFNQTERDLYGVELKGGEAISRAYFENVTLKRAPGFERLYGDLPVTVFERPFHEDKVLTAVAVMPHAVSAGKPAVVLCKARMNTELEVAVYSADGKDKQMVLFSGKAEGGSDGHAGIHILQWDGSDPAGKVKLAQGDYRVRWTSSTGYREFPVTVGE